MTTNSQTPTAEQQFAQQEIIKTAVLQFLDQTQYSFIESILPDVEMAVFTSDHFIESDRHSDYVFFIQLIKKLIASIEKARIVGTQLSDDYITIQIQ